MKTVLDRHEQLLREQLERMTPRHDVALAASCAELLAPNYRTFATESGWGDPAELDRVIATAWQCGSATSVEANVITDLVERCTAIAPDTETFEQLSVSAALNSVSAAVAALEAFVSSPPLHALDAARATIDTVWGYVQVRDELDPNDPELEAKITNDPLMRTELARQAAVIDALSQSPTVDPGVVARIRALSPPLVLRYS